MKRFINPVPQYFDNDVNILSGGKVNFYENGSTTTRKNTYNANNGSINTNPVVLSSDGRLPPCWGEGLYTVVVTDADGVQVWQRNDVEFGGDDGQFSDWSAVKNYAIKEIVRYTDGDYYISQSNNNLGNAPADDSASWSKILFIEVWNTNKPGGYAEDDVVVDGGYLFRSKIDDNESLTSDTDYWENLTFNNSIVGSFSVSEGIDLGNTENSDPNILDWYEEVSPPMTPVVIGSSSAGSGTYTFQVSRETRIGNVVDFTIFVQWTAHTGTGNLLIGTLKYDAETYTAISVTPLTGISPGAGRQLCAWIPVGENKVYLNYFDSTTGAVADLPMDTAGAIMVSGSYIRQP
jgi:hypothetical protein